jgi:hypothetical protein
MSSHQLAHYRSRSSNFSDGSADPAKIKSPTLYDHELAGGGSKLGDIEWHVFTETFELLMSGQGLWGHFTVLYELLYPGNYVPSADATNKEKVKYIEYSEAKRKALTRLKESVQSIQWPVFQGNHFETCRNRTHSTLALTFAAHYSITAHRICSCCSVFLISIPK